MAFLTSDLLASEASGLTTLETAHQLLLQTLSLNIDLNSASFNIPLPSCWVREARNPLFFPPKNIFLIANF